MIYRQKYSKILVPQKDFSSFLDVVSSSPIEVGGLLVGYPRGDSLYCVRIMVGRNVLDSPYEFRLDDSFIARVVSELSGKEDIIGIIHSHPAPPIPSGLDRRYMELWPVVWIIIDSRTMDYRAWLDTHEIEIILY